MTPGGRRYRLAGLHRRRLTSPVITSMRRYSLDVSLSSSLCLSLSAYADCPLEMGGSSPAVRTNREKARESGSDYRRVMLVALTTMSFWRNSSASFPLTVCQYVASKVSAMTSNNTTSSW